MGHKGCYFHALKQYSLKQPSHLEELVLTALNAKMGRCETHRLLLAHVRVLWLLKHKHLCQPVGLVLAIVGDL